MTRRTIAAALSAVVCALTSIGCSSTPPEQENDVSSSSPPASPAPSDPDTRLRERPSFEAAQRQYTAVVTDTANQIAALVPGLTWQIEENSWGGCTGEFADTEGVDAYIRAVFSGPTPDPLWPRAVGIVKDAAAELGATSTQPMVDHPADHEVIFSNPDGVQVTFGTAKATVLSAKSECRLRERGSTKPSATP